MQKFFSKNFIKINIKQQTLNLYALASSIKYNDSNYIDKIQKKIIKTYSISTAKKGIGNIQNSLQTPLGCHYIRAKIGAEAAKTCIFKGRKVINSLDSGTLNWQINNQSMPNNDYILSRIMWLCGLEIGKNRLDDLDTMQRFIYIHGSLYPSGKPHSKGCICMTPDDVIDLFNKVDVYTQVHINAS